MESTSAEYATDTFSFDSQQTRNMRWNVAHRIGFRIAFCFILLTLLPFPFGADSFYQTTAYQRMWSSIAAWLCAHLLHIPATPSAAASFTLADNAIGYVELLCFVVLAALAGIAWTAFDRKRPHYRTLHGCLRIYVRYALAFAMLGYGMDKVFVLQFNWSLPGPTRLAEPLGNYSPFALLWTFMGYSTPYTIFTGVGEVTGGVLLFFRRTTTVGALIVCFVVSNVVALNFSYGVGVKIFSSLLVFLAIFLLVPDLGRLIKVFILNRPVPAGNLDSPIPSHWMRRTRPVLHTAFVIFALYWFAGPGLAGPRERGRRPKSPLYGLYQVEAFTRNGKPVAPSDTNWRRVIFEGQTDMTVLAMDDSMHYYGAEVNLSKNTVTISGERNLDSNEQNAPLLNGILTFSRPDADHLELHGDLVNQPIVINLRKVDTSKYLLASRGFHWVDSPPLYR